MNPCIDLSRRRLIIGTGAALAVAVIPCVRVKADPDTAARIVAVFGRPASAAAVGRAYLARFPEEASRSVLVGKLDLVHFRGADDELRSRLRSLAMQEYASGQVEMIDGWVLARSELRRCALATLV